MGSERFDHLLIQYICSHVQGCHAGLVYGVDLGTVLGQDGENRVGPVRDGQVEPGVPVAAVRSRIHLGPVFAQDAETQDGVVLDVCQGPLDLFPGFVHVVEVMGQCRSIGWNVARPLVSLE